MSTPEQNIPAPPAPPEEQGPQTSFDGLTLHAERDADAGRWRLYVELNGVRWVVAERKLGGLDDDLQEKATPGFKEARAVRAALESGRPRTEPGPGA